MSTTPTTISQSYDVSITGSKTCERCEDCQSTTVTLDKWQMADILNYLPQEIEEQFQLDGWKHGHCPNCAIELGKEWAAEHAADDRKDELMEVES